ncbi:apolipoprotein N-acyltransferase [Sphingomonas cavernae]|uniref:Apolipoprotein N-acyltransferase n=1 Tax=Sphingomonas cavernae TaxID=2320861 RepID=A0A418WKM3_9SPHN|nr:apolipoprotein N-acyltransferase [Sphingomonas cavernae]RJF90379.1 apolipoprotein N-acyltransferase [Sphingomonas cavernae]
MPHPLILAILAGLASDTGFAPLNLWPVTLAAFALLLHLIRRAPDMKRALLIGWLFGVAHFSLGLNWIAHAFSYQDAMPHWFGYGAVILLSLYLAVWPAMAAGLAWRWGRGHRTAYVLIFAAAWIVTEWLRATMFTGFAWNPLGVALVPIGSLPDLARYIGTYGLSGFAVLGSGMLWLFVRREWKPALVIGVPLVILCLLPKSFSTTTDADGPRIRVVQPNIGQQDKHNEAFDGVNYNKLASLTGRPGPEPRLIFWPEAAIPDFLEEDPFARERLASLLGPRDMLLTGGLALIGDREGNVIGARNSLFALTPDARLIARYDKAHLVPYGEYLPMRSILVPLGFSRLVPGDTDFWPGPGPVSLDLPGFGRVGGQICYEIIFSGHVADAKNRPDFIFNPSNDAWFGSWGPPQHLAQARLRAIEEGLPVIRSTPTGISAVVDAEGRVLKSLPHQTAGFIDARLPAPHAPTLFARFGNILPFMLAMILVGLAVALRRRAR